jgi:hypothetical protein
MAITYATLMMEFKDQPIAALRNIVDNPHPTALREFQTMVRSAMLGNNRAYARLVLATDVARKTVTCSASAAANGDTLVIGGTTLTVAASPANESEFVKGSTDALHAAATVAAINAHTTLSKYVWAAVTTSASGILTIYCKFPGPVGNFITLAETGNGFTVGGAVLASGASDECDEYGLGMVPNQEVAG